MGRVMWSLGGDRVRESGVGGGWGLVWRGWRIGLGVCRSAKF